MKTSEFKAILDEMDLAAYETKEGFRVIDSNYTFATVNNRREHVMKIYMDAHAILGREAVAELFELLTAYASTPLSEREEPKLYYLRDPVITTGYNYLAIHNEMQHRQYTDLPDSLLGDFYQFTDLDDSDMGYWQYGFTRAEIDAFEFEHAHLIEKEVENDGR
ncbi:hypothetical protein [Paenilisteria rocourtiae]|uniref:Uncharacterized protein n=1 Tax=Listeria rocourtiae TaxID=647910 RepID=A0A4R6ZR14_9LIST|nr:hypothetical protein [Listeria rocourtiae]EUJ44435.1 hypothetical protein PROCOU_14068 [Listeria rocourtiae FSL F6-920]TDR55081.1 hypothetical protein DFP96_1017 [Listeria rocourtiae]